MFLDLIDVGVRHRGRPSPSVDGVSLSLQVGEIGVLIGPSGCGKTTLLRAVAGLEPLSAGEVWLASTQVSGVQVHVPAQSRRVGMVFQDYALFPHMTVGKNIEFGLHGWTSTQRKGRVGEVLDLVGMTPSAARYPHELSGGQQQRVALARALAPQPHLLLLDEPFSNLDVEMRERLALEVRSILKEARTTALLVTHDQQEAFAMGDRVGVMAQGRLHQWDDGYSVYHRPSTRFVASFIGHGQFASARYVQSHGVMELRTPLGSFQVTASDRRMDCDSDGACDVLMRADDIFIDMESPFRADVVQMTFRGSEFLYTLRLDSGETVLASVLKHQGHAVGDRIGIRAELEHIVTFPQTTTGLSTPIVQDGVPAE
jgi:iron(III) transport system ATP-binding protein